MTTAIKHDIALLDFLRGWSALLVFFHHAAILGGGPNKLAGFIGHEAVNVFMLASGFLIYFQCSISKSYQNLETSTGLTNFAIRRFFRIAPAYYVCLIIALLLADQLGESREAIGDVLPKTMTDLNRYYIESPLESFFVHITFIFGLIPNYAFSTPLPDWSLGLEMQFYLIFPLLFFFYRKNFSLFFTLSLCIMATMGLTIHAMGVDYPMPTLIALKFHNFASGMAIAHILLHPDNKKNNLVIIGVTLVFLVLLNEKPIMPLVFLACLWWICFIDSHHRDASFRWLNWIFNNKINKFLSEISYSLYIVHLMFMLPFFAYLLNGHTLTGAEWLAGTLALLLVVAPVSYAIYRLIELPGISLGKHLIHKVRPSKPLVSN